MTRLPVLAVSAFAAAVAVIATAPSSFAATPSAASPSSAVFVQTDDLEHNSIVAFTRGTDGRLDRVGEFRTGGRGGVERDVPLDSLASQDSLTYDPAVLGRPTGFRITINEVYPAAGAGFVVAQAGDAGRVT